MQVTRCDLIALALAVAVFSASGAANADEGADDEVRRPYEVFVYARPQEKNYFRLALEEVGILAAGSVEYFQTQDLQSGDWDLSYSADSFESKVRGRSISFDSNKFGTNWITHPLAGWLYYGAARGNRLGPVESLFVATVSSATWEFFGEYREQVAINDLMVTPIAGAAISESMLQLGAWFERGRPTPARVAAAWLLAPGKRIHDAVDDAVPLHSPDAPRGELEARLHASLGPTWESSGDRPRRDVSVGVRTRLFVGPSLDEPGRVHRWLNDGNLSAMRLEATMRDESFVDLRAAARVAFAGYYTKNVVMGPDGPIGAGSFLGLGTGVDYQIHEYALDRPTHVTDDLALIELLGLTLETFQRVGPLRVRTGMMVAGDFAGATALARDEYVRTRGTTGLPTVAAENGYTHAFGGTVAPTLRVTLPPVTLLAEARLDAFRSVLARDRYYTRYEPTVSGSDERLLGAVSVQYAIMPSLDVALRAARTFRRSRLDDVTATYGETGLRLEAALRL